MSSQTTGKAAVIIVNYNGLPHISECVRSVIEQSYSPIEIVVVDNASQDGSLELIKKDFPQVKLIQTGYNAGWGIACNVGIHATESEYVVLLNNDALMDKDCVKKMVEASRLNPRYGSVASRILLWDKPELTEVCGLVIYPDGSSCGRGRLQPANSYLTQEEVFCANDCCCLYRRSMLQEIGDYDPDFFIYCDETDIGWKHQLAGWKCIYTPDAIAYHAHSQSAGSYSVLKAFHVERNRLYICMKYFSIGRFLLSFPYSFSRYLLQVYYSISQKKGALANFGKSHSLLFGFWILLKVHLAAFFKLPHMWRKRAQIKKIRKISESEINQLFKRFGITTAQIASYE